MKLIILSLAAAFLGRPAGFHTANADDTALQEQVNRQEKEIEQLKKQLASNTPAQPEDNGTLALLCNGAGVPLADVRWRVQGGLDPEQAVQAAINQRDFDEAKKKAAKAKK